jgi:hypothetical protein
LKLNNFWNNNRLTVFFDKFSKTFTNGEQITAIK